jgi:hypothetical protein
MLDSSFRNMYIMILILCTCRYDITPSDYVSMLITEYGMVRCASTSQSILCACKNIIFNIHKFFVLFAAGLLFLAVFCNVMFTIQFISCQLLGYATSPHWFDRFELQLFSASSSYNRQLHYDEISSY